MNEISQTNHIIFRRTRHYRFLVSGEKFSLPPCPTSAYYPDGGKRHFEQGYRQRAWDLPPDCATMASAFLIFTSARARKGRASSGTQVTHSTAKDQRGYRGHTSYDTAKCDTLEHAQHGQGFQYQQGDGMPDMATAQSQTAPGRDLQTQPRQTLRRKASGYRWAVPQPAGQGARSMRRREEPDSGPRPDTAHVSAAFRHSGAPNIRLHAAWDNNIIRRLEYARWQGHRRLHAQTSPSGIYPILTAHKCQNPTGFGPASYCRQLWHPQTSAGLKMAQASSPVPSSLHANVQLMAQHGGALVQGHHRQAYPPRFIQKRSGPNQRHYAVSRESQPESSRFYLERVSRTDYDKDHQM